MELLLNQHDVIIVGAGPAGSTCAAQLNKAGLKVKLFDKKTFPRVKPCAGWVTPQVIEALKLDLDEYRQQNTIQPITGFRTGIIGGRIVENNYPNPVSFGILRVEFDDYLLRRSGVPCDYQPANQIVRDNKQWRINNNDIAPLLIGAGGHFCPVARLARENSENEITTQDQAPVVFAQEVEFKMSDLQRSDNSIDARKPELYFCPDLKGYGWCFRKGDYLNIGMGRADKLDLASHVKSFCRFLQSKHKLVDKLPEHFLGHAYRLYAGRQPKLCDDGLLLIGDAAGLAYPQSGEGIRPAVESAIIAANVAVQANGNYGLESLADYERRMVDRLGAVKPIQSTSWLPVAWLQNIAAGLMATKWFARKTVIENWFLHCQQSALEI